MSRRRDADAPDWRSVSKERERVLKGLVALLQPDDARALERSVKALINNITRPDVPDELAGAELNTLLLLVTDVVVACQAGGTASSSSSEDGAAAAAELQAATERYNRNLQALQQEARETRQAFDQVRDELWTARARVEQLQEENQALHKKLRLADEMADALVEAEKEEKRERRHKK